MQTFHELEVTNVTANTKNSIVVAFNIPIELKEKFQFKAGQHIILDFKLERNAYSRTYSICSAPHETKLCISVKRQNKGIISNYINDGFFKGLIVRVSEPFGNFYKDDHIINSSTILLWAGGSGITPIISIAKHILASLPDKKVELVYANKDEKSIMFKSEVDDLKNKYSKTFSVTHILSNNTATTNYLSKLIGFSSTKKQWTGLNGYVTKELVHSIVNQLSNATHYICGPEKMMEICELALESNNIKSVYTEKFVGTSSINNSNKEAVLKVNLFKKEYEINLFENNLLDAMLGKKLNPPHACKTGTCGTCKAKLISGEVIMARDFALNEADRADGKILCCQTWAKSAEIKIEF
jgi:ring-1,2-phenylacetyl-CoA epoxidase subunit PaaE